MKLRFLILACFVLAISGLATAQQTDNPCIQVAGVNAPFTLPPPQPSVIMQLTYATTRLTNQANSTWNDLINAQNFLAMGDYSDAGTAIQSAFNDLSPILYTGFKPSEPVTKEGK
jgi:hypothetical protein